MEKRVSSVELGLAIDSGITGSPEQRLALDLQDARRELERLARFHCDRVLSLESQRAEQAEKIERLKDAILRMEAYDLRAENNSLRGEIQRFKSAHDGEICVDVQEHCERLEARNAEYRQLLNEARGTHGEVCNGTMCNLKDRIGIALAQEGT